MANSTFFKLVKTQKSIEEITDFVTDRLIITKNGNLYFDYSSDLRIEINKHIFYKYSGTFTTLGNLYDNVLLKYDELLSITPNIDVIKNDCIVFDGEGNYALITHLYPAAKKCTCVILGIISNVVRTELIAKLNNDLVGNFMVVRNLNNITSIQFDKVDVITGDKVTDSINFISPNKSININNDDENNITLDANISKKEGNLLQIIEDGLMVCAYSRYEIDSMFSDLTFYRFEGPFDTIADIGTYNRNVLYLVKNAEDPNPPYDIFAYIRTSLHYLGKTGFKKTYNQDELNAMFEEVYVAIQDNKNYINESLSIERLPKNADIDTEEITISDYQG